MTRQPGLRRHPLRLLVIATFCLLLATCSPNEVDDGATRTPAPTGTEGPQRIVSLVPTVTEILFAIGANDRIVGISDYDSYPPEALDRPRVGALINPNVELIIALDPDLVVTYGTQALLHERLKEVGIDHYAFVSGGVDHVIDAIGTLGDMLDLESGAESVIREIESTIDRLRATKPPSSPTVLLVHSRDVGVLANFYSAGRESYFGELIEIAGGENLFDDVTANAFQPSLEEVISRGPEVIVELLPSDAGGTESVQARMDDWQQLTSVPAVRNDRVHVIVGDYLMLVGPRLHLVAEAIAAAVRTHDISER